jgi:hypothetical protein
MGARKRAAPPTQAPEVGTIYKYGAKKPSDIGGARWISQVYTISADVKEIYMLLSGRQPTAGLLNALLYSTAVLFHTIPAAALLAFDTVLCPGVPSDS